MRVLITSGGGAKGAFSVGVLQYLKRIKNITHFDFISGTSTGALIACLASIGRIDQLSQVYLTTTNSDILKPQNLIDSLVAGKPFVYDTEPLFRQIDKNIDIPTYNEIMASATTLCFNAISLQSGRLTVFATKPIIPDNQYDTIQINSRDLLFKALLGSSNQAVFMNPIRINNDDYVDGGNREVIPTRVVVNNLPVDQEHEIYILSNNPNDLVTFPGKKYSSLLDVLMRAITMFIQEVRENDLELMGKFKTQYDISKPNPAHNLRIYYICPPSELDKDFPTGLRFDPLKMIKWMSKGEEVADEVLSTSPNGNFPMFHPSNKPFGP